MTESLWGGKFRVVKQTHGNGHESFAVQCRGPLKDRYDDPCNPASESFDLWKTVRTETSDMEFVNYDKAHTFANQCWARWVDSFKVVAT